MVIESGRDVSVCKILLVPDSYKKKEKEDFRKDSIF